MVWISDATDPGTEFVLQRFGNQGDNRVGWELIEYVGDPNGPNELVVLDAAAVSYFAGDLTVAGLPVPGVGHTARNRPAPRGL